ncbi:hypothetical protein [Zavarzinella formosa]|uniref:hypothetical protein n=1 Tax=Zavarzinella formosa TaxID=360055 RepID=UPI00030F0136|nr:hypothetical protein [Zavarzinella formosa]
MTRTAIRSLAFALLAGITLPGCSDSKRPPTFPVTGKVMYNKTTVPAGAMVYFHPLDPEVEKKNGGKPFGKVKEDGTYLLTMYGPDDGAPEGEYGVTFDWRGKPKDAPKFQLTEEGGPVGKPLLNPKYGNPQQPVFKVTVKKGEKNEFNFDVD